MARLVEKSGLPFARRSRITEPLPEMPPIVLLDTIGELGVAWGLADIGFTGGSLDGQRGGQSMIEPAGYGVPCVFGPHVWNFRDAAKRLVEVGGAVMVTDADTLEMEIAKLATDTTCRERMGREAGKLVQCQQGASQPDTSGNTRPCHRANRRLIPAPLNLGLNSMPAIKGRGVLMFTNRAESARAILSSCVEFLTPHTSNAHARLFDSYWRGAAPILITLAVLLQAPSPSHAQNYTWSATTGGTWGDGTNWGNALTSNYPRNANDTAIFSTTGDSSAKTVTLDAAISILRSSVWSESDWQCHHLLWHRRSADAHQYGRSADHDHCQYRLG